jgi:hypothetical protein
MMAESVLQAFEWVWVEKSEKHLFTYKLHEQRTLSCFPF